MLIITLFSTVCYRMGVSNIVKKIILYLIHCFTLIFLLRRMNDGVTPFMSLHLFHRHSNCVLMVLTRRHLIYPSLRHSCQPFFLIVVFRHSIINLKKYIRDMCTVSTILFFSCDSIFFANRAIST